MTVGIILLFLGGMAVIGGAIGAWLETRDQKEAKRNVQ